MVTLPVNYYALVDLERSTSPQSQVVTFAREEFSSMLESWKADLVRLQELRNENAQLRAEKAVPAEA